MEKAAERCGMALLQLQNDREAMKDPTVSQAVLAWQVALLGLAAQADPLRQFRKAGVSRR
jgi:hypothetical protein